MIGESCRPLAAATAAAEGGLLEDEAAAVEVGPGADGSHRGMRSRIGRPPVGAPLGAAPRWEVVDAGMEGAVVLQGGAPEGAAALRAGGCRPPPPKAEGSSRAARVAQRSVAKTKRAAGASRGGPRPSFPLPSLLERSGRLGALPLAGKEPAEASARARSMQHNARQGAVTVMASGSISPSSCEETKNAERIESMYNLMNPYLFFPVLFFCSSIFMVLKPSSWILPSIFGTMKANEGIDQARRSANWAPRRSYSI